MLKLGQKVEKEKRLVLKELIEEVKKEENSKKLVEK